MDKIDIAEWFKGLQDRICTSLEEVDGSSFQEDIWERPGGGGGKTRVIEGNVIEKGGVNFSAVYGTLNESAAASLHMPSSEFFATGVSIVLHPKNPWIPIIHMNVRYFQTEGDTWWFGGGIDLTPHYVNKEDAKYFHTELKETCDKSDPTYYPEFKKWADDYFYIKHRKETRGVGGIFFDRLGYQDGRNKGDCFGFVKDVGETFAPVYVHFMKKYMDKPFTSDHKEWQSLRRSRYVEFNLVYDRGTKFGLSTDGRTESILMSLPPKAKWKYDHNPSEGSEEALTNSLLRKEINWTD